MRELRVVPPRLKQADLKVCTATDDLLLGATIAWWNGETGFTDVLQVQHDDGSIETKNGFRIFPSDVYRGYVAILATPDIWHDVYFINGPLRGLNVGLKATPKKLVVGNMTYDRIDDPDTGEFLGGYAVVLG